MQRGWNEIGELNVFIRLTSEGTKYLATCPQAPKVSCTESSPAEALEAAEKAIKKAIVKTASGFEKSKSKSKRSGGRFAKKVKSSED